MNMIKLLTAAIAISLTVGCSFQTIPPTAKGKILTTAGYSPDILPPGKITTWGRDSLITIQTNTDTYSEPVSVVLSDKLTLKVDVKFRGRLAGSDQVINSMFNDIVPQEGQVTFRSVYNVYGRMAVRNKAREVISQYSVDDVHKNYARLSQELATAIKEALVNTPLEVSDVMLGNIQYPEVVTSAITLAKERELSIKKEEAQAQIDLTKKKNERLLAEADYQIQITRAKAIRDKNKIIGQGVTPALIELRRLEVLEAMAENKSAVFMPVEAMSGVGAQVRMFAGN